VDRFLRISRHVGLPGDFPGLWKNQKPESLGHPPVGSIDARPRKKREDGAPTFVMVLEKSKA
jgi:hypothetical protein